MRLKITLELSGNEFLDLIRRVPRTVAQQLYNGTVFQSPRKPDPNFFEQKELLNASARQLIETKKR